MAEKRKGPTPAPSKKRPAAKPAAAMGGTETAERVTRKEQILSLFRAGITDVADLAVLTRTRPSYVAAVLQEVSGAPGYFDLYTSTAQPMNVYSKFFAGKMSYRDVTAARESVALIDRLHRQFQVAGDRAGQHHALLVALTLFDRARWSGKTAEAAVFRDWLRQRLDEGAPSA